MAVGQPIWVQFVLAQEVLLALLNSYHTRLSLSPTNTDALAAERNGMNHTTNVFDLKDWCPFFCTQAALWGRGFFVLTRVFFQNE